MGNIVVGIAIFTVFVILCLGLYTLWKGGETAATYSNKLMRIRVLAQFVAIILIMIVLWASHAGQN